MGRPRHLRRDEPVLLQPPRAAPGRGRLRPPPLRHPADLMTAPVPAVGVVCLRGDEVLLIRRGKPPLQGAWSLPGGRIELGERAADAALRELSEETGVQAELI